MKNVSDALPGAISKQLNPCFMSMGIELLLTFFGSLDVPNMRAAVNTQWSFTNGPQSTLPCFPTSHELTVTHILLVVNQKDMVRLDWLVE